MRVHCAPSRSIRQPARGSVQTIEPGELIHAITIAVLASFIVTWILLAGYRRAVARTMRTASAQADLDTPIISPVASGNAICATRSPGNRRDRGATSVGAGLWRGFRPVGAGACAAAHLEDRPGIRRSSRGPVCFPIG